MATFITLAVIFLILWLIVNFLRALFRAPASAPSPPPPRPPRRQRSTPGLVALAPRPLPPIAAAEKRRCTFEIVGEGFCQDHLRELCGPKTAQGYSLHMPALLIHDPENEHDPNAVAVYIEAGRVGFLSRADAAAFVSRLEALGLSGRDVSCTGYISGGWSDGETAGDYGVKLGLKWPLELQTT